MIDIRSYGLHIVHGAVKHGLEATGWNIDDILYALFRLLKDAPTRQENYCKTIENKSPPMPLKFCATRWMENAPVIERAILVIPDMCKYVKSVESGKIANPGTKTYKLLGMLQETN